MNLEIPLSRPVLGHITVMFEYANSAQIFFFFFLENAKEHVKLICSRSARTHIMELGGLISSSILKSRTHRNRPHFEPTPNRESKRRCQKLSTIANFSEELFFLTGRIFLTLFPLSVFQAAGRGVYGPRSLERTREGGRERGRDREWRRKRGGK